MKDSRRIIVFLAILMICASCASKQEKAKEEEMSAELKPALIAAATLYKTDYQTGEWKEESRTEYTYENGYPRTRVRYENEDQAVLTDYAYVFEDGFPVSMEAKDNEGKILYVNEYQNGKLMKTTIGNIDEGSRRMRTYIYGNEDPFFTLVLHSSYEFFESDGRTFEENMEEVDEVTIDRHKNGLLKKSVNRGLYANYELNKDREWLRFNGTYTAQYDEDGILHALSSVFRAGPPGADVEFELVKEDGRIVEVIERNRQSEQEEWKKQARVVFEYSDIPVDPVRYSLMINAHVLGEISTYYIYNWY